MNPMVDQSDHFDVQVSEGRGRLSSESNHLLNRQCFIRDKDPISVICLLGNHKKADLSSVNQILSSSPNCLLVKSQVFKPESKIRLLPAELTLRSNARPADISQKRKSRILKMYFRSSDQKPLIDIEVTNLNNLVTDNDSSIYQELSIQELNSEDEFQIIQEENDSNIIAIEKKSVFSASSKSNIRLDHSSSNLTLIQIYWATYRSLLKPLLPTENVSIKNSLVFSNSRAGNPKVSIREQPKITTELHKSFSESEETGSASHSCWIIV